MANQFKFIRVDSFFDDINREDCFDTEDMDGITPNYKFVLAESCPQNINDCLDSDGTLDTSVVTLLILIIQRMVYVHYYILKELMVRELSLSMIRLYPMTLEKIQGMLKVSSL